MLIDSYGCDFIITDEGLCLLEINSGPALYMESTNFNDEKSFLLASEERALTTSKNLKKIWEENGEDKKGIAIIHHDIDHPQVKMLKEFLESYNIPVMISTKSLNNKEILDNWMRYEKTGAPTAIFELLSDKMALLKELENYEGDIKQPSDVIFKNKVYENCPNVVMKPLRGTCGEKIFFLKNLKLTGNIDGIIIKDKFAETFVKSKEVKTIKTYLGDGKYEIKNLENTHLADVRYTIAITNGKWYPLFSVKRVTQSPLPISLNEGRVPLNENGRFLTNLSKGSTPTYLTPEEDKEILRSAINVTQYIWNKRNEGKIKHILWTGGFDSTFRVMELLQYGFTVQPLYFTNIDVRQNIGHEIEAMIRIKHFINEKYPRYKDKILPTIYVYPHYIKIDPEIEKKCEFIKYGTHLIKERMGVQYRNFAHFIKTFGAKIEIGVEIGGRFEKLIKHLIKGKSGAAHIDPSLFKTELDHKLDIFKDFIFPVIHMNKFDMWWLAHNGGFVDVLNITWTCWYPNPVTNQPCGKCKMCGERNQSKKPGEIK
tara:strand:- start:1188 stop:2810 length:1623 start_codon:yes stop_codon:yes gene_type:complete